MKNYTSNNNPETSIQELLNTLQFQLKPSRFINFQGWYSELQRLMSELLASFKFMYREDRTYFSTLCQEHPEYSSQIKKHLNQEKQLLDDLNEYEGSLKEQFGKYFSAPFVFVRQPHFRWFAQRGDKLIARVCKHLDEQTTLVNEVYYRDLGIAG